MRKHRFLLHLLLVVGFALGQWCALVHASHHELLPHPEKTPCAICAIVHAAGVKPAPLNLPVPLLAQAEAPVARQPTDHHVCLVVSPPSRGPPQSFV